MEKSAALSLLAEHLIGLVVCHSAARLQNMPLVFKYGFAEQYFVAMNEYSITFRFSIRRAKFWFVFQETGHLYDLLNLEN